MTTQKSVENSSLGEQQSLNRRLIEEYSAFTKSDEETIELANSITDFFKTKEVVIYGAGTSGSLFFEVLSELDIKPICYIDRNADKIREFNGVSVYDSSRINALKNSNWVIIVAMNDTQTAARVIEYLQHMELEIPIFNGIDLVRVLRFPVCIQKGIDHEIFDILQCVKCGVDVRKCRIFTGFLKHESKFDPSKQSGSKKFDWVGYILGQICTLKCECCCEGIPFVKNGGLVKADNAISDIVKLTDSCEYLERLEFIGGEPFIHPELSRILNASLLMEKVGYIYIFTNGSIVPSDELCQILKNPRILIHISNYNDEWPQKLPNRMADIKSKFLEFGIKYMFIEHTNWLDISQFDANRLNDAKLEVEFAKCFINHCHRLYNGILYRCPHQFAGIQLNKLNLVEGQCIDIHKLSSQELTDALEVFENVKFLESCRFCSMPVGPKEVPAGKQVDETNNG